jgi:hypothetical protein
MPRQPGSPGLPGRATAALTLGLLAPLVAEYLLGDFRITNLALLPILVCVYGCGAVVIREIVRRKGGSWTVYLALALAFAVLEEGIVNQSLFNPDYLHLHLLAYGFWPRLGTSPHWVISVITLHVVWSLAVPIGMTESLFPERSSEPWLAWPGLSVAGSLFALGSLAVGRYSYRVASHHASPAQLTLCSVLILALLGFAFLSRRPRPAVGGLHPRVAPILLGTFCFLTGLVLVESYMLGAFILRLPGTVTAAAELGIDVLALSLLRRIWPGPWTALEVWSATAGGLLVYALHGYEVDRALHGPAGALDHTMVVLGLCAVQAAAWIRVTRFQEGRA